MRVQGLELDDAAIIAGFRAVEAARKTVILTYFEFGTLAALSAFATAGVDTWLLEIGLGGRLDAVNAVDPDAAVITNVTLDHCDWLGDDVESIAREKAGVMRMDIPVIFGAETVPRAIVDEAERRHADLRVAGRDFHAQCDGDAWHWRGRDRELRNLSLPALKGPFQVQNAAAVLALLEALGPGGMPGADDVNRALEGLSLPGRLQSVLRERHWLLDVAHNPDAARVVAAALAAKPQGGRLIAVLGVLADKDLDGILAALCPVVDSWVAVAAENSRALPAPALAARIANSCNRPCRIGGSIAAGLDLAAQLAAAEDRILVTGSFYTVGPALAILEAGDKAPAPHTAASLPQ